MSELQPPQAPHDPDRPPRHHAEHHIDLGFALPVAPTVSRTRVVAIAVLAGVIVAAAFFFGYLPKQRARAALGGDAPGHPAATAAKPIVLVVVPKVVSSGNSLVLAGNVTALEETVIYPRVAGYVKRWLVDIGDKVTEGQVLAEIDVPEADAEIAQAQAQLAQARAQLAQATANRAYSTANATRYKNLDDQSLVAKADSEKAAALAGSDVASVALATANVAAQQANLKRLMDVRVYQHVVAPFAGTITQRTIDRGTLVAAGNTTPLFRLAAADPVRVFVQVPQSVAPSVKPDLAATVTAREYGGRKFEGTVTRSAGVLDPQLRTMTTEVRVPNHDGALLPGMYVQVALSLPTPHHVLEVPATALFSDGQGLRLATVDRSDKIHFVTITIERDTGATIQVASGLDDDARVVKVASAGLVEGEAVKIAAEPAPATPASPASVPAAPVPAAPVPAAPSAPAPAAPAAPVPAAPAAPAPAAPAAPVPAAPAAK